MTGWQRLPALRASLFFVFLIGASALADDWPQWGGPRRDGRWRETGIVEKLPSALEVVWRREIGAGYASPSVAAGRVFVIDRTLSAGAQNPDDPFARERVRGSERVLCLDATHGEIVWEHVYPCEYAISYGSGPRAAPTVDEGRVFAIGAMGDFYALDAASGEVIWKKSYVGDFGTEINAWGMAAAPLVDGDRLILLAGGTDGRAVLALDKRTGAELWRSLDVADPGYCPPTIIDEGGVRQLIVWTPQALTSLDPATGKVLWSEAFAVKSSLSIAAPIHDAERHLLLVTAFYDGPMMLRLGADAPSASVLWRGQSRSERETDGIHGLMSTPIFAGGHVYGICSYGQLRCIESETGKRVWETFAATGEGRWWNAFITPHEDRYFIANEQGELITAKLSPAGYEETSRAFLITPTSRAQRRKVVWSHPAYANRRVYARSDKEIVCVELAARRESQTCENRPFSPDSSLRMLDGLLAARGAAGGD